MQERYLYEKIEMLDDMGMLSSIPEFVIDGLSNKIELREYQKKAFQYFITYYENENIRKNKQIHNLFHMATGSGKTVIMAGLILYLYTKGYRKFLFFVNQSNVVEKTKENFLNPLSNKYLFNNDLNYRGNHLKIEMVENFTQRLDDTIEICFTTTQKLHLDLLTPKENSITYKDFEENKVVFISDESHHVNTLTKKETKTEEADRNSWEYSVLNAFMQNKDNVMLEFTATADLRDKNVEQKYKDKIIFDYQLKKFRESGYTKDFQNFATESELWDRTLMALVLSEYRKYLFNDNRLNIKPVIMLKSQKIADSEEFYEVFFKKIENLTSYELMNLYEPNIEILNKALNYFKDKDETFELLEHSIKNSFTKETSIIMNDESDNNKDKQLLVNSLEDLTNPIRTIFTVDMLNEGWDVLNLFDIVRLYDTRQGSGKAGKIGNYTIREAQLIGRGARYCPFTIKEGQEKYKRKYDSDLTNDLRILETMYFHSKNDSKYITELRQALIETGLQDRDPIKLDYQLKEEFKQSDFYQNTYIFSNKRIPQNRISVVDIEDKLKNMVYRYTVKMNQGTVINLMDDSEIPNTIKMKVATYKFKDIDYHILIGAAERFDELKFDVIKMKYPNVSSMKEFLTSENYLGNSTLEISYVDNINGKDLRNACIKAFTSISNHIVSLEQEYEGTKVFEPILLKDILKDKSIYLSHIDENGGRGASQNNCNNEAYRLDLSHEKWYVFNDNYGTSEEKLFLKFFKTYIAPKLLERNLEFYVIRNERVPEMAIYSFAHGERFEPDFLLLVKKEGNDKSILHQVYIEPKGDNLLEEDKWKENFLLKLESEVYPNSLFTYGKEYKILGLPFYNQNYKRAEFEEAINQWIETIIT